MTQHPTLETLSGYILAPQDQEYRDVRRHLLSCAQCRQSSDHLSTVAQQLREQAPQLQHNATTDETSLDSIALAQSPLSAEQLQAIKQSPAALKAALHSLTHSAAMQRGLNTQDFHKAPADNSTAKASAHNTQVQHKSFQQWWQGLFNWSTTAWINVPVTAAVVFALTFVLTTQLKQSNNAPVITAYQDNPVVTFQPAGAARPGIGFFSNVPSTSKPFAPVDVKVSRDNTLSLHWPAIHKAVGYTVEINEIQGASSTRVFQQSTKQASARFNAFKPHKDRRYTWSISGTTKDGRQFHAKGGFVVKLTLRY